MEEIIIDNDGSRLFCDVVNQIMGNSSEVKNNIETEIISKIGITKEEFYKLYESKASIIESGFTSAQIRALCRLANDYNILGFNIEELSDTFIDTCILQKRKGINSYKITCKDLINYALMKDDVSRVRIATDLIITPNRLEELMNSKITINESGLSKKQVSILCKLAGINSETIFGYDYEKYIIERQPPRILKPVSSEPIGNKDLQQMGIIGKQGFEKQKKRIRFKGTVAAFAIFAFAAAALYNLRQESESVKSERNFTYIGIVKEGAHAQLPKGNEEIGNRIIAYRTFKDNTGFFRITETTFNRRGLAVAQISDGFAGETKEAVVNYNDIETSCRISNDFFEGIEYQAGLRDDIEEYNMPNNYGGITKVQKGYDFYCSLPDKNENVKVIYTDGSSIAIGQIPSDKIKYYTDELGQSHFVEEPGLQAGPHDGAIILNNLGTDNSTVTISSDLQGERNGE